MKNLWIINCSKQQVYIFLHIWFVLLKFLTSLFHACLQIVKYYQLVVWHQCQHVGMSTCGSSNELLSFENHSSEMHYSGRIYEEKSSLLSIALASVHLAFGNFSRISRLGFYFGNSMHSYSTTYLNQTNRL